MTLNRHDPILGVVRLCRGCGEEWPMDEEFWYMDYRGNVPRPYGRCRACWSERNRDHHQRRKFPRMAVA